MSSYNKLVAKSWTQKMLIPLDQIVDCAFDLIGTVLKKDREKYTQSLNTDNKCYSKPKLL